MDILQNIVLPQSPTHILLLKYLLFLTLLLLLPYLSVLIGTTLFSVMHFNKGKKKADTTHLKFANELIDIFTVNFGMSISLGLIPLFSILFIYAQLFLNSDLNVTSHLFFGLLLFVAAILNIYAYKFSFRLKNIFNLVNVSSISDDHLVKDFEGMQKKNSRLLSKSGTIGLILILIVAYIVISVLQLSINSSAWNESSSLIETLFSYNALLYFIFYLAFSFSITSAAIIYKYFKSNNKNYDQKYLDYIKNFSLKTGLIFTVIQPLLFVLASISLPGSALSFEYFVISGVVLALMLMVNVMFYLMYKDSRTHLGGSAVFVFLLLISAIIYKDQVALDTASQIQIYNLENDYKLYAEKVKLDAGIKEIVEINGEDIYNAKCIACHRFDTKLVGPAYKDVLPKYEGKREELVGFILNPVKINPEFTAMPNQGLKPKEAEAIAEYIMNTYKK